MFVLMDLEWIQISATCERPSQLAALRVDHEWNVLDTFYEICRPKGAPEYDWSLMGFSGKTADEFKSAPKVKHVLEAFCRWIRPDDVLLWWTFDPSNAFKIFLKRNANVELDNESRVLRTVFRDFVQDGFKKKGNVYQLAQARSLPLLQPEHCALNDVNMLLELLKNVRFQSDWLFQSPPFPKSYSTNYDLSQPLQLDTASNILHVKGCCLLEGLRTIKGGSSYSTFVKQKVKPCPICCKKEWNAFIESRNRDVITRSQCHYFYLPKGRSFHKADCYFVRKSLEVPRGVMYYHTAAETGRFPCKCCKPTAADDPYLKKSKPTIIRSSVALQKEKRWKIIQQPLTRAEMQAVKRHAQASKEREQKRMLVKTEQEKADFYTLTATRYAFWAAKGYSNFHEYNCPKLNGLSNLRGFARFSDALSAGYSPCRHCKPTSKSDAVLSIPIYNQTRKNESVEDIIALCQSKGYQCTYVHPNLTITTLVGQWIVDITKRPIFIEHQHTALSPQGPSALHWQHRMFLSLKDVVLYIEKHDSKEPSKSSEDSVG